MNKTNQSEPEEPCAPRRSIVKALKFNAWLAVTALTYLVMLYLVQKYPEWSPGWKVTATLVPVLPGLLYLRSGLRLFQGMDELQRRIQMEAWLFAAIGTVIVSAVINVLNANGIQWREVPHGLEIGGTYLAMFLLWCIGISWANQRYQ